MPRRHTSYTRRAFDTPIRARLCSARSAELVLQACGRRGGGLCSPAHGLRALRLRLPVVAQLQRWPSRCSCKAVLRVPGEHAGRCAPPRRLWLPDRARHGHSDLPEGRPGLSVRVLDRHNGACELSRSRPTAGVMPAIPADSTSSEPSNESALWDAHLPAYQKPHTQEESENSKKVGRQRHKDTSSARAGQVAPHRYRHVRAVVRLTRRHTGGTRRRPEGRAPHRCGWPPTDSGKARQTLLARRASTARRHRHRHALCRSRPNAAKMSFS